MRRQPPFPSTSLGLQSKTPANLLLFKYQKKVKVPGHGEYDIEVTNVMNANTMQVQPLFPSLMDS